MPFQFARRVLRNSDHVVGNFYQLVGPTGTSYDPNEFFCYNAGCDLLPQACASSFEVGKDSSEDKVPMLGPGL